MLLSKLSQKLLLSTQSDDDDDDDDDNDGCHGRIAFHRWVLGVFLVY
jgi:hypothetical protein